MDHWRQDDFEVHFNRQRLVLHLLLALGFSVASFWLAFTGDHNFTAFNFLMLLTGAMFFLGATLFIAKLLFGTRLAYKFDRAGIRDYRHPGVLIPWDAIERAENLKVERSHQSSWPFRLKTTIWIIAYHVSDDFDVGETVSRSISRLHRWDSIGFPDFLTAQNTNLMHDRLVAGFNHYAPERLGVERCSQANVQPYRAGFELHW